METKEKGVIKQDLGKSSPTIGEMAPVDPVLRRMSELEVMPSTKLAYNEITKLKIREFIAQISLECESEANHMMASIEKIRGVKDIQTELLYKGEEAVEVPPLPIIEMRVVDSNTFVDPKTKRVIPVVTQVVYGLEASMTSHRVIFLDIDVSSTPRMTKKTVDTNSIFDNKKQIEISHHITSSFTYIPISYPDILGLTCDIKNGVATRALMSEQRLWIFSLIPIILGAILAGFVHWSLVFIALLGIPFFLFTRPIKHNSPPARTQIKVLKLAVINPETKKIATFELDIPQIYSLDALLLWIKELQFRSPSLQHTSEMNKNLNVNIG